MMQRAGGMVIICGSDSVGNLALRAARVSVGTIRAATTERRRMLGR
jgi:hypothetical protein